MLSWGNRQSEAACSTMASPPFSSSRRSHHHVDDPEYVAIILAATLGTRLFPLTSPPHGIPKHLLPISPLLGGGGGGGSGGGMSTPIDRLLGKIYASGIFELIILVIHANDEITIPYLLGERGGGGGDDNIVTKGAGLCEMFTEMTLAGSSKTEEEINPSTMTELEYITSTQSIRKGKPSIAMRIRVVKLPENCKGSADALRYLTFSSSRGCNVAEDSTMNSGGEGGNNSCRKEVAESHGGGRNSSILPPTSHALVMPGDLMLEGDLLRHGTMSTDISSSTSYDGSNVLSTLVEAHRRWNTSSSNGNDERNSVAACTMLLTNVGVEDKDGVPIKESSKAKMNLFVRNEEDVEYIALSSEIPSPPSLSLANLSGVDGSGPSPSRRVVLKRSKLEVEEDEGTGSTPKLLVARRLLHAAGVDRREDRTKNGGRRRRRLMTATSDTTVIDMSPSISLHTDLHDVHLYVISNWVFDLIHARPKMHSFQAEVLPLLISRQFKGIEAVFGPTVLKEETNRDRLRQVLKDIDRVHVHGDYKGCGVVNKTSTLLGMYASGKVSGGLKGFIPDDDDNDNVDGMNSAGGSGGDLMDPSSTATTTPKTVPDISSNNSSALQTTTTTTTRHRYAVSAQVLSRDASSLTLRTCTIPSLLYGCSEVTSRILKVEPDTTASSSSSSLVTKGARLSTKFNSIIMPICTLGEKVQTKSCTIGQNVVLGDKAKLNNVLVMDGATIGSNTVLQQCIVGVNANIGMNCNLKDCQVGPSAVVKAGTKSLKGEAFEA